jgi:hypothetical protein
MPICDPSKSGIIDDPRQSYYTDVAAHTNIYAVDKLGWGGVYSRRFNPSTPEEHVNLDGIYSRNKNENILDNYDVDSELRFDKVIAETMGVRRLLDLNDQSNYASTTRKRERERRDMIQQRSTD